MAEKSATSKDPAQRTDAEWKQVLSPMEFQVARCSATEPAFTGRYWNHKGKGMYHCVACGEQLFSSDTKFDSGTGWPSFWEVVDRSKVEEIVDRSHGMVRTEVRCKRCGSHLGHLFEDGPEPSGERYCINSASLRFGAETGQSK